MKITILLQILQTEKRWANRNSPTAGLFPSQAPAQCQLELTFQVMSAKLESEGGREGGKEG